MDHGYEPVAICPGQKKPGLDNWTAGHPPETFLAAGQGKWGTGILTRSTAAVDIDILNRDLVHLLIEIADETIGRTLVRFGNRPKALLPFRVETPFPKATTRWYALPGEDLEAEGYKPHRCETLGDGQQFVAFARHPRGVFYRWHRGDPLDVPRNMLPELDAGKAARFMAAADNIMVAAECLEVERVPGTKRWRKPEPKPTPKARGRSRAKSGYPDSTWKSLPLDDLALRIDPRGRRKSGYWHLRCPAHNDRHPSMSLSRKGGQLYWKCFSGCSGAEVAGAIERLV